MFSEVGRRRVSGRADPAPTNRRGGRSMEDIMTDKQMEVILNLVADKFAACQTVEDVKMAIKEVREMASKDKKE